MALIKYSDFLGADYITGLKLTWVGGDALTIGTGAAYLPAANPILVSTPIALTGMTLANSTWYYLYLYDNAGTPAVEYSTTAPAAAYFGRARTKTGDTSRRYLYAIKTNASAQFDNFIHDGQNHLINVSYTGAQYVLLSGGTDTTATAISVANSVPDGTSRICTMMVNTGTANIVLCDSAGGLLRAAEAGARNEVTLPVSGTNIYYYVTAGGIATFNLVGWDMPR